MNSYRTILLVVLISLMTSCAQMTLQKPEGYERYNTAVVEVISILPDLESENDMLTLAIIEELKKRALFQQVSVMKEEATTEALRVKVVIVAINRTSDATRIAQGQFARSNEVTVEVYLMDNLTHEELTTFSLKGVSPERTGFRTEWPWGSVAQAIEKVSQQLGKQLAEWSK